MNVVVLGASGAVGGAALENLLKRPAEQVARILLIGRRELPGITDPRVSQSVVDVDKIGDSAALLAGFNVAIVAMGVGRASGVSKEELYRVDVTIPSNFASAAKAAGVPSVVLLTAVGADITATHSRITGSGAGGGWYAHCKGAVEDNFQKLSFPSLAIFRPSTITGNPNTPKAWEFIAKGIDRLLPVKYKKISAADLGAAMVTAGLRGAAQTQVAAGAPQCHFFEGQALFDLVNGAGAL